MELPTTLEVSDVRPHIAHPPAQRGCNITRDTFCCVVNVHPSKVPGLMLRLLHLLAWACVLAGAIAVQAGPAFIMSMRFHELACRPSCGLGVVQAALYATFSPIILWLVLPFFLCCIKVPVADSGRWKAHESIYSRCCCPMDYSRTGTRGLDNLLVLQTYGIHTIFRILLVLLAHGAGGVIGVNGGKAYGEYVRISSSAVRSVDGFSSIAALPSEHAFRFQASIVTSCEPNASAAIERKADSSGTSRRIGKAMCIAPLLGPVGADSAVNVSAFVGCVCGGDCRAQNGRPCACAEWGQPGGCPGFVDVFPLVTEPAYFARALAAMAAEHGVHAAPGARLGVVADPDVYIAGVREWAMLTNLVPLAGLAFAFLLVALPTIIGRETDITCLDA